ncbi:hypothetical protein E5163_08410 [Marinicauda algicola]|uniref:Uncharacterized protein n=1 Tax=Marinicauda algicola TaxID=2029849 RepID=A0A4S2H0R6_9PROT|nr:hypothetical protein [Marinicauda algicola]TGY89137.1 hypothetical protein E5163_08410 [Marinicauda algicola]
MTALAILLPAAVCAAIALAMRRRLARLSLMGWLGAALIGTGLPLLAGQLTSLALTDWAIAQGESCVADCRSATEILALPLVAGLAGGLGWLAGAITAIVSKRSQ